MKCIFKCFSFSPLSFSFDIKSCLSFIKKHTVLVSKLIYHVKQSFCWENHSIGSARRAASFHLFSLLFIICLNKLLKLKEKSWAVYFLLFVCWCDSISTASCNITMLQIAFDDKIRPNRRIIIASDAILGHVESLKVSNTEFIYLEKSSSHIIGKWYATDQFHSSQMQMNFI